MKIVGIIRVVVENGVKYTVMKILIITIAIAILAANILVFQLG